MMLAALLPRLGRFALALVVLAGLILSSGTTVCIEDEHHRECGGDLPTHLSCSCTCAASVAVVPAPIVPMPVVLPVTLAETEYCHGRLPEVVFSVDPPPDKRA